MAEVLAVRDLVRPLALVDVLHLALRAEQLDGHTCVTGFLSDYT
jgi:hypothetical protein